MIKRARLAVTLPALCLAACATAPDRVQQNTDGTQGPVQTHYAGYYNGNSFETAMGMRIDEDGSFEWGLSVGALDMHAKGKWAPQGDGIVFTSDPVPVPPTFSWSGFGKVPNGPLVKIEWAESGEPFQYAEAVVRCANGHIVQSRVPAEGWSPDPDKCDVPVWLRLIEGIYNIDSEDFLLSDYDLAPGETIRFLFHRNDLGVADFTGFTAKLEESILTLTGHERPMRFRKVEHSEPAEAQP